MKMFIRVAFLITVILTSFAGWSQNALSPEASLLINQIRQNVNYTRDHADLPESLIQEYDLLKRNGEYIVRAAILVDNDFKASDFKALRARIGSNTGRVVTVSIPLDNLDLLTEVTGVKYIEVSGGAAPFLENLVPDARVDSVHTGLGGLAGSYTGDGVIICVIDWGFDYTHPVFYDDDLQNLRISRAWDQNKKSGPAPAGFDFGTEYVGQDELLTAGSDTEYVFGSGSHGTHVAGIAGGSGGGTVHSGVAPDAELLFVSLRRDAPSYTDAITWVRNYAASVGKPFVVNMSFGSHLGPHDGTDMKNFAIDDMAGPGRVFVGSAGNNGSNPFHLFRDFNENPDTLRTVFDFRSDNIAESFGQTLVMWGSEGSSFSARVKLLSGTNTVVESPVYHSAQSPVTLDTFFVPNTNDTLIMRITATAASPMNGKPNIRMEVGRTGNYRGLLEVVSNDSEFHVWNVVRMNNRYTNWGGDLRNTYPGAEAGNIDFGPGEPGGVGKNVITVASHRAEEIFGQTVIRGHLSGFSSKGPTVDMRQKPNICAPGESVISSVNSFDPNPGSIVDSVQHNGKTYFFSPFSGTSMSGPAVAGVAALMLQANPGLNHLQVREIMQTTARMDQHTGDLTNNPDLRWGYGKVNALACVLQAEMVVSNNELSPLNFTGTVYPNPAQEYIHIKNAENLNGFTIYDLKGTEVSNGRIDRGGPEGAQVNVSHLPRGLYLIKLTGTNENRLEKVLIQQ